MTSAEFTRHALSRGYIVYIEILSHNITEILLSGAF